MALLAVKGLTFTYPDGISPALADIDFEADEGEFVVICGRSGCGKSTLLRHFKTVLAPHGKREGRVYFSGRELSEVGQREQTSEIGFVFQNPDNQIVTDKVWHELAFGLESLGLSPPLIRLRTAEMASFFGIGDWYHRSVFELSGGQKQILNLAAVMAMKPRVLIMDEPTSQLDPIAASHFLATAKKVNDELGTTILLSEHRLEEALPLADRVTVMSRGTIIAEDTPARVGRALMDAGDPMLHAMPAPIRIYLSIEGAAAESCPVTVREGRSYLRERMRGKIADEDRREGARAESRTVDQTNRESAVLLKDVWFRYGKDEPDILRGLSLQVKYGELCCIVGGNGSGKTTALRAISGILKPYRGRVSAGGLNASTATHTELFRQGLGVLPQDAKTMFTRKTIREDMSDLPQSDEESIRRVAALTEIEHLLERHPYDVSEGEQQRASLAKVLLNEPKILLLDEPTKGMDSFFKQKFARVLSKLKAEGAAILMVSHDIEFCAEYADRCALLFDGAVVSEGAPRDFFAGNSFYTTTANRMCGDLFPGAVTAEEVMRRCDARS
ncbi:MAG: ATP-binding cassette domain-containing protein [Clostridiales Family XIII bacterium]|jgi:energy-coupling factor transport system ATP-binding protein|nr:ATP-binding cassette domain-containing protein [Clostridiales Family XIII bacterium]